jgi:hypothetical protein
MTKIRTEVRAASGMQPTNSRLAEQNFGAMRHSLNDGVSLQRTDAERALMNAEYYAREERRALVIARKKEHDKQCGNETKATKGSIKHDKQKAEQQMVGEQLLARGTMYERSEWEKLSKYFRKEAGVHQVKKKGLLHLDKDLEEQKTEREAERHAKRRSIPLSMSDWEAKARDACVGNDANWQDPETTQRLEKLRTKSFWQISGG